MQALPLQAHRFAGHFFSSLNVLHAAGGGGGGFGGGVTQECVLGFQVLVLPCSHRQRMAVRALVVPEQ